MGKRAEGEESKPLNEFAVAFGQRLRGARTAVSPTVTQEDLGRQFGLKKTNVSQWETGRHMPDLEILASICNFLKCSADDLLGREHQDLSAAALAEARAFDALPPEAQKKWRAMRLTMFSPVA